MTRNPQVSEPPSTLTAQEPSTSRATSVYARTVGDTPPTVAPDFAQHQLHVAMTWHRRGHPVIPCGRDKRPLVPRFGQDATPEELAKFYDENKIREWWTGKFRRAHVGILTRRLVVVDLDMRKPDTEITGRFADAQGGTDVLEALMHDAGAEWPATYTVLTPSGGMHLYFEMPGGEPIGCATGDGTTPPHIGPLVDVRGVGGLVIAAGSHSLAQGRPYTRVSPAGLQPQPLPGWLLEILRPANRPAPPPRPTPARLVLTAGSSRADRYAVKALDGQADAVRSAGEGDRWRVLTAATLRLAELSHTAPGVLTESAVREQLLAATSLPDREAERAFRSAWAKGTGHGTLGGAA
jgi:hypothetical protein